MSISAADVFISYKAEDRARLRPLVTALESEGLSVWWDAHIPAGANWRREIEEHLDAAKCVIVAWSKRSVAPEGHFVRDEAGRAMQLGTYLPIRIDAVNPPLGFGEVQAISLQGWKGKASDPRFATLVTAAKARIAGEGTELTRWHADPPRISRRAVAGGAIGLGAIAVAGGWAFLRTGVANAKRIAVLPFMNLSNDPAQDYFSDGIAEELRSALSRLGMEVIGRASSIAVKDLDTKSAAAKLNVANILTGSVRRSPDLIRVTAQLVGGKDGVERWAQSYDRAPGDAISIQTDIAANVARALSIALGQAGRAALTLGGTADSVAQDLVLRSRERTVTADSPGDFEQALKLADAAISRDRQYAEAYLQRSKILTAIAENYPADSADVARRLAGAEVAANRAARIAPQLGAPHVALARIAQNRFDIVGLLRRTEKALSLSPYDPEVLLDASTTMAVLGRGEEGMKLADRLIALDGLNARAYARKGLVMLLLRRYPDAIDAVRQANEIAPGNPARAATVGDAWLLSGNPDKARAEYAKMPADDYQRLTGEAISAIKLGDRAGGQRLLNRLSEVYGPSANYQYAMIHAQLGDRDRAFAELQNALSVKDPGLINLKTDAFFDPLRDDPRYAELIGKLNFPS